MAKVQIEGTIYGGKAYLTYLKTSGTDFRFVAELPDGNEVEAKSITGLVAGLKKALAVTKKPIRIPVCKSGYDGWTHYEVVGIHAGNGGLFLEDANGKRSDHSRYGGGGIYRPISAADEAKIKALNERIARLTEQRQAIEKSYEWPFAEVAELAAKQQRGEE